MAIRTSAELLDMIKNLIGDRTDDEAIQVVEDFTDSLKIEGKDWEAEYKRNDEEWRQRYRRRFFEGQSVGESPREEEQAMDDPAPAQETEAIVTYEQLFKEEDK